MTEPLKVVFGPGCFDAFEGTQEELEALKAEIERLFAEGGLPADARRLTEAEEREVAEQLAKTAQRS